MTMHQKFNTGTEYNMRYIFVYQNEESTCTFIQKILKGFTHEQNFFGMGEPFNWIVKNLTKKIIL